jgi:glucan phosphorylase
MSNEQLEQRLAAVEKAVAEMQQKIDALTNGATQKRWQPPVLPPLPPMTPEEAERFEAVRQYIRKTGDAPPPDWKPGDPIPDPEWWS